MSKDATRSPGQTLTLIAARARGGVIGMGGDMPWHIPADLKFFKAQTLGKTVVMGRLTFNAIGKALPGRQNIIVSRRLSAAPAGTQIAASLADALAAAASDEVMIIGGGQLYAAALPLARRLILTEIDLEVPGDTWFPAIDEADWREIWREDHPATAGEKPLPAFGFRILERSGSTDSTGSTGTTANNAQRHQTGL